MTVNTTNGTINNVAENTSDIAMDNGYEVNLKIFWAGTLFYLVFALIAIIGNGLVLYALKKNINFGCLWHLDGVIKSLATADMLFGLLGAPSNIMYFYCKYVIQIGKYESIGACRTNTNIYE